MHYRKIYEKYHGLIPKDKSGRTYEIHHIDGNRSNNDINNLEALSIEEHYKLHLLNEDYAACLSLAFRMKLDDKTISELSRTVQRKRIENGTHNFLKENTTSSILNSQRIKSGTHNFLKSNRKSNIQYGFTSEHAKFVAKNKFVKYAEMEEDEWNKWWSSKKDIRVDGQPNYNKIAAKRYRDEHRKHKS